MEFGNSVWCFSKILEGFVVVLSHSISFNRWRSVLPCIRLSDFTFIFHFHALEREMATHSSILAWRISGTGEPGGLPSMGLHRVGHD